MPRRHRSYQHDRPPTLRDVIDASGFGWAVDLAKTVVFLAFIAGGVWLRYHVATTALTNAFQQIAPQPSQPVPASP